MTVGPVGPVLGPKYKITYTTNKLSGQNTAKTMEEVKSFLQDASLTKYETLFQEMGYDDLNHLLKMNHEELLELKATVNMLPGHFARMKKTITSWQHRISTPSASTVSSAGSVPSTVGPVLSADEIDASMVQMGPVERGASMDQMGPFPMGPVPMGPSLGCLSPFQADPAAKASTWDDARLVSMAYSSELGCSAMLDNSASGSRRKVVRCRSVLSRKKRPRTDSEDEVTGGCPHLLIWTKDRTGKWTLRLDKSHVAHAPFCNSGQYVTAFELVRDAEFVKSQKLGKLSTGKEAAKLALGFHGRIDGSVSEHTARRARNTIQHYDKKDYDDDWCKLNEWGQKFMELNPDSRFHLHDEDGRLVGLPVCGPKWAHMLSWA